MIKYVKSSKNTKNTQNLKNNQQQIKIKKSHSCASYYSAHLLKRIVKSPPPWDLSKEIGREDLLLENWSSIGATTQLSNVEQWNFASVHGKRKTWVESTWWISNKRMNRYMVGGKKTWNWSIYCRFWTRHTSCHRSKPESWYSSREEGNKRILHVNCQYASPHGILKYSFSGKGGCAINHHEWLYGKWHSSYLGKSHFKRQKTPCHREFHHLLQPPPLIIQMNGASKLIDGEEQWLLVHSILNLTQHMKKEHKDRSVAKGFTCVCVELFIHKLTISNC